MRLLAVASLLALATPALAQSPVDSLYSTSAGTETLSGPPPVAVVPEPAAAMATVPAVPAIPCVTTIVPASPAAGTSGGATTAVNQDCAPGAAATAPGVQVTAPQPPAAAPVAAAAAAPTVAAVPVGPTTTIMRGGKIVEITPPLPKAPTTKPVGYDAKAKRDVNGNIIADAPTADVNMATPALRNDNNLPGDSILLKH